MSEVVPMPIKDASPSEGFAALVADSAKLRLHSALRFRLGGLTLAIPSQCVKAVVELRPVCTVPYRRRTAFLGLVAYGGEILPCCSLARLLGLVDEAEGREARTIVLEERAGERWAFPVEAALGITTGTPQMGASCTALPAEWIEQTLRDEAGTSVDLLRPDTLFARFARAVG